MGATDVRRRRACLLVAALALALLGPVAIGTPPAGADANLGGTITASDPDQNGRLNRNQVVATCAAAKANPGFAPNTTGTDFDYDAYALSAAPGSCVTVTLSTPDGNLMVAAYSPHFNAADPTFNYLADAGSSALPNNPVSFSFLAPPSGTFVLVVSATAPGGGGSYTLQVTGANVFGLVQDGTIAAGDATQNGRLLRNTTTSTCASPKANPGLSPGTSGTNFQYDPYQFAAPAGTCVSVALKAPTENLFVVAYSPTFSPGDPTANYLADPGFSTGTTGGVVTFSFVSPGGFILVVSNTVPGATGPYTLEIGNVAAAAPPADTTPPTCFVSAIRRPGPSGRDEMDVTVQDTGSGLAAITNIQITNGTVVTNPNPIPPGTTSPVVVTAIKAVQGQPTVWSFDAVDVAGNVRHCA